MAKLVEYKGFMQFLEEQTFKTYQMENCQTLRVSAPVNDTIVAINHGYSTYVDQAYFKKYFKVDEKYPRSYSVKTVGVECGWILNSPEGYKFLIALN